jgi:5-methylcytosine-specific restriction protein A
MTTIVTKKANATKKANSTKPDNHITAKKAERQAIYNTRRWTRLRKEMLMQHPICQICQKALAEHVHHIDSFMNYTGQTRIDVAYNSDNLQCVCAECHNQLHNEHEKIKK